MDDVKNEKKRIFFKKHEDVKKKRLAERIRREILRTGGKTIQQIYEKERDWTERVVLVCLNADKLATLDNYFNELDGSVRAEIIRHNPNISTLRFYMNEPSWEARREILNHNPSIACKEVFLMEFNRAKKEEWGHSNTLYIEIFRLLVELVRKNPKELASPEMYNYMLSQRNEIVKLYSRTEKKFVMKRLISCGEKVRKEMLRQNREGLTSRENYLRETSYRVKGEMAMCRPDLFATQEEYDACDNWAMRAALISANPSLATQENLEKERKIGSFWKLRARIYIENPSLITKRNFELENEKPLRDLMLDVKARAFASKNIEQKITGTI